VTNNEVHEQLIEWLGDLLGVTVIKDRQQADRPAAPYGMVDLANWRNLHEHVDDVKFVDVELPPEDEDGDPIQAVKATPDLEIEWVFLFFVYGAQGENLVRRLQSAVHLSQLQEPLRPALTIHEVSAANSIPELVGELWEPRTQVNIVVRGKSSDGFIVDVIEEHGFNFTGERA
jgi:hypothetical protein